MKHTWIPQVMLAIAACGPSAAQHPPARPGAKPDTAFVELRKNMLAAHAAFDSAPIIDLRQRGRCEAVIGTARGQEPLRWKDMGNLITRLQNGRTLVRVPANGRVHVISAPTEKIADRIGMGLGLYDEECGGV